MKKKNVIKTESPIFTSSVNRKEENLHLTYYSRGTPHIYDLRVIL